MDTFTKEQKEAIDFSDGIAMTIAGPGSGKTTVITYRVKQLIEKHKVLPENILVITFTKAAALEMKNRFFMITKGKYPSVTFGTFHSIFFMILRVAYHYSSSQVIGEDRKYQMIRNIVRQMHIEYADEEDFISDIVAEISYVKSEMIAIEFFYSNCCGETVFRTIFQKYEKAMRSENLIDFDDMLVFTYELLKERKDILDFWSSKFQYILIDEFQDIDRIQYEIVKLLMKKNENLFIVGDDDQSIYGFRGAKPGYMVHFQDAFPNCKVICLHHNFRSSKEILLLSMDIIEDNKERIEKHFLSVKGCSGELVHFHALKKNKEQLLHVLQCISNYQKMGIPLNQMAVIFRTNLEPHSFIYKCIEYGVPYYASEHVPGLYSHFIAKDILTYVRLAMGARDRNLFIQILNKPVRYLRRDYLYMDPVDLDKVCDLLLEENKGWMIKRVEELEKQLQFLSHLSPAGAVNYIRKVIGYEGYLKEYAEERMLSYDDFLFVLNELEEEACNYKNYASWLLAIEELESETERIKKNGEKDGISIMTMHGVKGLEYEVVFILDVNDGFLPHRKAKTPAEIEEERRLFYVAVTRAKKYLHIYSIQNLYGRDLKKSAFIQALEKKNVDSLTAVKL